MAADADRERWSHLSRWIAEKTGLHFPPERQADLERGITDAAKELGFAGGGECRDWLLSTHITGPQLRRVASYLTIGETYFFRERNTFDALATQVLPELIRLRRGTEQRLRVWSAACSTGEEPYSLAILLRQLLPDWHDWHVTILATDINPRSLQTAKAAIYGEWSFRETPPELRERYFTRTPDRRFVLAPEIRKCVTFAELNLVEDAFPSLASGTNAMDLILCRNVLMYFRPDQARAVAEGLRHALLDDGWLVVGAPECSQNLLSGFASVNFPGAILYQKRKPVAEATAHARSQDPTWARTPAAALRASQSARRRERHRPGRMTRNEPQDPGQVARTLANDGRLSESLAWSERWIRADKLNAAAHYLHAMVAQELGDRTSARRSLQRAMFLEPDFILAHFAFANLARTEVREQEARRHFASALRLLRKLPAGAIIPESDGLTAGRLTQIISTLPEPVRDRPAS